MGLLLKYYISLKACKTSKVLIRSRTIRCQNFLFLKTYLFKTITYFKSFILIVPNTVVFWNVGVLVFEKLTKLITNLSIFYAQSNFKYYLHSNNEVE